VSWTTSLHRVNAAHRRATLTNTTVQNDDSKVQYSGSWTTQSGPNFNGGTSTYTSGPNNAFTFSFEGECRSGFVLRPTSSPARFSARLNGYVLDGPSPRESSAHLSLRDIHLRRPGQRPRAIRRLPQRLVFARCAAQRPIRVRRRVRKVLRKAAWSRVLCGWLARRDTRGPARQWRAGRRGRHVLWCVMSCHPSPHTVFSSSRIAHRTAPRSRGSSYSYGDQHH